MSKSLSQEIREKFRNYFESESHSWVTSASLRPKADSGLLFTNAGMNPFKDYFLGLTEPPHPRLCSIQKCLRAGGKHNDLEEVGDSPYHHTFFEMMGMFSFGDYFKKEACAHAMNFLTKELNFPRDRLWVTVFKEDEESAEIWRKTQNIPQNRIFYLGEKDNFWRMGNAGPCGPCSEIYYYDGPKKQPTPEDMTEIWNLVFMEFNEDSKGRKTPLPKACVDTGMGLERLISFIQGKKSNYQTDIFSNIINSIEQASGKKYDFTKFNQEDLQKAFRVLADHSRAASFLIAEGTLPGSDGASYVLRRILRRAFFYGNKLDPNKNLLKIASEAVIKDMASIYPELKREKKLIQNTIEEENSLFMNSLLQGRSILIKKIKRLQTSILPNDLVWDLYSTYGFPPDLTRLIAKEQGFNLQKDFNLQEFKKQNKSKKTDELKAHQKMVNISFEGLLKTQFTGYEKSSEKDSKILKRISIDKAWWLILDKTCFYPEGGGPIGDQGFIKTKTGSARIEDCQKKGEHFILHKIGEEEGRLSEGQTCEIEVQLNHRKQIASSHSATHLLNRALRKILGNSVSQQGSLVKPGFLRFDFSYPKPLSPAQLKEIEQEVQNYIAAKDPVSASVHSYEEARNQGAILLKGENYGEEVRVIRMGASLEFCGGIHVQNTREIQGFKIISETGVQSGVRRIQAYTHDKLKAWEEQLENQNKALRKYLKLDEMVKSPEKIQPFINWFLEQEAEIQFLKNKLKQAWSQGKEIKVKKYLETARTQTYGKNFLVQQNEELRNYLKLSLPKEVEEADYFISFAKKREKEVSNLKKQVSHLHASSSPEELVKQAQDFEYQKQKGKLLTVTFPIEDSKILSEIADQLKSRLTSASIVVVLGEGQDAHPIVVCVSKELQKDLGAGWLLKNKIAPFLEGRGGGQPRFAQGKIKNKALFPQLAQELIKLFKQNI